MTPDQVRQVNTAQWHAQEAFARQAIGDLDLVAYHLDAGCEFLALVTGRKPRCETPDDLIAACCNVVDTSNVIWF